MLPMGPFGRNCQFSIATLEYDKSAAKLIEPQGNLMKWKEQLNGDCPGGDSRARSTARRFKSRLSTCVILGQSINRLGIGGTQRSCLLPGDIRTDYALCEPYRFWCQHMSHPLTLLEW